MHRKRGFWLLLLIPASGLLLLHGLSLAYLDQAWLSGTGIQLIDGPGTIRLAGMGNLTLAIEDENNQANLYDFARNTASVVLDKTTRNTDAWSGFGKWMDEKDGIRWQDVGIWQTGGLVILRSGDKYAGGASISTRILDLNRVDDDEFRSIVHVNFPKSEVSRPETTLIETELTSTSVEGFFSHKVFGIAYLGVRGWGTFEGEQKPVISYYSLLNSVDDLGGGVSFVLVPQKWLQVGGTIDLGSQLVESTSSDAFHDDVYTRKRGVLTFSSQAQVELVQKLRGVVNFKRRTYDADQTLKMNWSDIYRLNPEDTDIRAKLKVASESYESNLLATRWVFSGLPVPLTVSGYFDLLLEDTWEHAEPNALVWSDDYDQALQSWNLAGGTSYRVGEKGTVGVELRFNRGRLENRLPLEEGYVHFNAVDLRGGGEFRVLSWLALRGGYAQCNEDRNLSVDNDGEWTSTTLSAGAGCYLLQERMSIETAFTQKVTEPDVDPGFERQIRSQALVLYGRLLF
ncbi:MAG: hypothetical protein V2A71_02740 [Candidatus Eisenbacteria bacterium]